MARSGTGRKVWLAGMFSQDGTASIAVRETNQKGVEYILRLLAELTALDPEERERLRALGARRDRMKFIAEVEEYTSQWKEPAYVILQSEVIR